LADRGVLGWVVTYYEIRVLGFGYWWLGWVVLRLTPPVPGRCHPGWCVGFLAGLSPARRLGFLASATGGWAGWSYGWRRLFPGAATLAGGWGSWLGCHCLPGWDGCWIWSGTPFSGQRSSTWRRWIAVWWTISAHWMNPSHQPVARDRWARGEQNRQPLHDVDSTPQSQRLAPCCVEDGGSAGGLPNAQ